MRLLICGGREFTDVEYAIPLMMRLHNNIPVDVVISGKAKGGDSLGVAWANELGILVDAYPISKADWKTLGKAAGPIRNQQMLDEGKPDAVLALPGGNGTAHMVEIAQKAGIPVTVCRYNYFQKEDTVWGFLSNFYPREFMGPQQPAGVPQYDDEYTILYRSNEHYYQAAKTLDPVRHKQILDAETAGAAKKLGQSKSLPIRDDWETYKLVAMMDGLRLKFPPSGPKAELTDRLLHSGFDYLVEYAPWGDTFWGVDKEKKGQNWLGRLLMRRRTEIMTGNLYD